MTLSAAACAELVTLANLAPSVHNTQPTRWRLQSDGSVLVLEDTSRRLPVGDPDGRDALVSHGSAIEGFAIAASPTLRVAVQAAEPGAGPDDALRPVARLTLSPGSGADTLLDVLPTRRSYRGTFADQPCDAALDRLQSAPDICLVRDRAGLKQIAALNDAASLRTMRNRAFRAELVSWMRLSRRHPGWSSDGLNFESLQMSGAEAAAAGVTLRPGIFEALDRFGLAAPLTSDAKIVQGAAAVALFFRPSGDGLLDVGRRYHRFWLELEAVGLSAAPMAVLADDLPARAAISASFGVPATHRLITAFRIGAAPHGTRLRAARLPIDVLVV